MGRRLSHPTSSPKAGPDCALACYLADSAPIEAISAFVSFHSPYRSVNLSRLRAAVELSKCHSSCVLRSLAERERLAPILQTQFGVTFQIDILST